MAKIAIDCDEVLIDTLLGVLEYAKIHLGRTREYDDVKHYLLSQNTDFNITASEDIQLFLDYAISDIAKKAPTVPGAKEMLEEWKTAGHTLYVLTARSDHRRPLTDYQIEKYYPNMFADILYAHFYTEQETTKGAICKDHNIDILIDDNIDNCLEASEKGVHTILLKRPWNVWREETHPLMEKIDSWADIKTTHIFLDKMNLAKG